MSLRPLSEYLADIRKAVVNRWPAGAPDKRGGQFAPKNATGGAGGTKAGEDALAALPKGQYLPTGRKVPMRVAGDARKDAERVVERTKPKVATVAVSDLIATQEEVRATRTRGFIKDPPSDADHELPTVVRDGGGSLFIVDGHHRLVAAKLRGETEVRVQVHETADRLAPAALPKKDRVIRERSALEDNPALESWMRGQTTRDLLIYHGRSIEGLEDALKNGLGPLSGGNTQRKGQHGQLFITSVRRDAETFAKYAVQNRAAPKDGVVFVIRAPPKTDLEWGMNGIENFATVPGGRIPASWIQGYRVFKADGTKGRYVRVRDVGKAAGEWFDAAGLVYSVLLAEPDAEALAKMNPNRWPAGAPGKKGGQYAPKNAVGGGGGGGEAAPVRQASGGGGGKKPTAKPPPIEDDLSPGEADYMAAMFGGNWGGLWGGGGWSQQGASYAPPKPPKGARPHPKKDDAGKTVTIDYPTKPSGSATWHDAGALATFTPGSKVPKSIGGVEFKPWSDVPKSAAEWNRVPGQKPELDINNPLPEVASVTVASKIPGGPPQVKPGKQAAGVIVVEKDGRMWITRPTNSFGGYQHTFPKGTVEAGINLQASAIKEAYEETGLRVEITGVVGDYQRSTGNARYYLARRVGGTPADMGWESQAVRLVPAKYLKSILNAPIDRSIIDDLLEEGVIRKAALEVRVGKGWKEQPRWPAGSAIGGQWKAYDAAGILMPPKVGSAKNPVYGKKALGLYSAAQQGDLAAIEAAIKGLQPQFDKWSAAQAGGPKATSHVKWNAGLAEYAQALKEGLQKAPAVEAKAAKLTEKTTPAGLAVPGDALDLKAMTKYSEKPGGSAQGAVYTDANGVKYLVKSYKTASQAQNEVLASKLMIAAGIPAPEMSLVMLPKGAFSTVAGNGGVGVASKWQDGLMKLGSGPEWQQKFALSKAQEQFAVHAWLADWDVVGLSNDNLMLNQQGQVVCIDPGGSMLFRAQGSLKAKEHFLNQPLVPELKTLRDPGLNPTAAKVFGSMTEAQLVASIDKVLALKPDAIKAMVDAYGPGDAKMKAQVAEALIKRRETLSLLRDSLVAGMKNKDAAPAAPAPAVNRPPKAEGVVAHSTTLGTVTIPGAEPPPSQAAVPAPPEFNTGLPSDKWYTKQAQTAAALAGSGDLNALTNWAYHEGKYGGKQWKEHTQNGMKLETYVNGLINAGSAAKAQNVQATVQAAENGLQHVQAEALAQGIPKPGETKTPDKPAMPAKTAYEHTVLPSHSAATVKDSKKHNAKLDLIEELGSKGDVKSILAMSYGSNHYGQKQAYYANNVLAALGSPEKVVSGQKANSHAALTGGIAPAAVAAAGIKQAPAPKSKPVAPAVTQAKPIYRIPSPPDFENWNGPGKGLSGHAAFNTQNTDIANKLYSLAVKGDLEGLKNFQYQAIDANGAKVGAPKPISQHPSVNQIVPYWKDLQVAMTTPYVPPPKVSLPEYAEVKYTEFKMLGTAFPDPSALAGAPARIGRYGVLGKVEGDPFKNWQVKELSVKNGKVSEKALHKASYESFSTKLTQLEKSAIKEYTNSGYGTMNDAVTGVGTHQKTGYVIKAMEKASIPLVPGMVLSRKFTIGAGSLQELIHQSQGKILKDFGIISTSTKPEVWSGNVQLRIIVGEGVKGLFVGQGAPGEPKISVHTPEHEVVLPYGTKFYVRRVHPPGTTFTDEHGTWGNGNKVVIEVIALPNM